jgi:hypothetical protein
VVQQDAEEAGGFVVNKEAVMVKIEIPENCGQCRFNTDMYIDCDTQFCTLGSFSIRNINTIHKDCLLIKVKKGVVVYDANCK